MKRTCHTHTKLKKLTRLMQWETWQTVGILESLWALTARETPAGDIGKLSNADIAVGIDYGGDADALIAALVECGWLDMSRHFRLIVHDWHDHADDAVKKAVARGQLKWASRQVETDPELSGHVATSPDMSRLPEPEPEPKPEPVTKCESRPDKSGQAQTSPDMVGLTDIAREIHERHPRHRRGNIRETERDLAMAVMDAVNQRALAEEINRRHKAWCHSAEWRERGCVPGLTKWLTQGGHMREPPEDADPDAPPGWARDLLAKEGA